MNTPPGPDHNQQFHQDTNEVQEFVTKIQTGWFMWGNWVMGALVLASASLFVYNLMHSHQESTKDSAYYNLGSDSPEVLADSAGKETYSTVAIQAALRGADLFETKAKASEKPDEAQKMLASAKNLYKQVEGNAASSAIFRANAVLGLANVAEDEKKWDEAAAAYDRVIAMSGALPNLIATAKQRKALLPQIKPDIAYGPEPEPVKEPAKDATANIAPIPAIPAPAGMTQGPLKN